MSGFSTCPSVDRHCKNVANRCIVSMDCGGQKQCNLVFYTWTIPSTLATINSMMLQYWTLLTTLLMTMGDSTMAEQERNLTFMLVASFGQFGFNSSGIVPAADLALENINNDPRILKGYRLTYGNVWNSQVSYLKNHSNHSSLRSIHNTHSS